MDLCICWQGWQFFFWSSEPWIQVELISESILKVEEGITPYILSYPATVISQNQIKRFCAPTLPYKQSFP